MIKKKMSSEKVGEEFSKKWWGKKTLPNLYEDLINKLSDRSYITKSSAKRVNRAFVVCEYILQNIKPGSRVLDMACGLGFVSHCLIKKGYRAEGFDVSESGIEKARDAATRLKQNPEMFTVSDQRYLYNLPERSFDVVLALGYFRYLEQSEQGDIYKHVLRILKKGGIFIVDHQNILFEMFALNEDSLRFWADFIDDNSGVRTLFDKQNIFEALSKKIKFPKRKYEDHSISKTMLTDSQNPLTYASVAERYGFKVERILYPYMEIIPPILRDEIREEEIEALEEKVCLEKINDWRAMFMCYQFLAILKKE